MGLKVENLCFSYGKRRVLEGIEFEVGEGEVCAILGPNGSGKTTLIKCLNRLLTPNFGRIEVNGLDVLKEDRNTLARTFAYLPQFHERTFPYKVKEMVLMGRTPYFSYFSSPEKEDLELAERVLDEMGCGHLKERTFNTLSGGERQLVYIARAMLQEAKVFLLDEPTSHLDFRNELLVMERIRRLVKGKNLIAVVALHNPNEVLWFADMVVLLHQGRVFQSGIPSHVITPSTIEDVYGVKVEIFSLDGRKGVIPV